MDGMGVDRCTWVEPRPSGVGAAKACRGVYELPSPYIKGLGASYFDAPAIISFLSSTNSFSYSR